MKNEACPYLPDAGGELGPWVTRRHAEKGAAFHADALRYAQWQWCAGKPAQAILQLNKAWMVEVGCGEGRPYAALAWILRSAAGGERGFLGNPVRHFQHLASRMSGPRSELRTWRAWYCFHLAEAVLGAPGFPRDGEQLAREGLWIPSRERARNELGRRGETPDY